jgi:hypothetical protein
VFGQLQVGASLPSIVHRRKQAGRVVAQARACGIAAPAGTIRQSYRTRHEFDPGPVDPFLGPGFPSLSMITDAHGPEWPIYAPVLPLNLAYGDYHSHSRRLGPHACGTGWRFVTPGTGGPRP